MITKLELNKNREQILDPIATDKTGNAYQPSDLTMEMRSKIIADIQDSYSIYHRSYEEFNNKSLIQRQSEDQRSFNTFQPPRSEDPDFQWQCLSEDSEILTLDGWKGIGQIKEGDGVLSYDLETEELKPDTVRDYFEYDYDGEMVNIKNRNTDQLITPNHRTIVKRLVDTSWEGCQVRYWEEKYSYVEAQNLNRSIYEFPLSGYYDGQFSIGEDWAELVGWMLTDGCFDGKGMYITQNKSATLTRLRNLLVAMKVPFREWSREKELNGKKCYDEHRFYFKSDNIVSQKMHELIPNRKPSNVLLHLPLAEKRRLLEGLCYGDGTLAKDVGKYTIISKPYEDFKEWLQTLLHLMGISGQIADKYVALRHNPVVQVEGKSRTRVQYKGKVWSINTGRTNYIARRNGLIFITGNSNAVRGIVRNRIISIAAHVTNSMLYPKVFAQNENDEEDRAAASVMRDLMEYAAYESSYEQNFVYAVIAALVNPASILHHEYRTVYRTIRGKDGKNKQIIDPDESGFKLSIVPVDELWIGNIYEHNIQRQPFLVWRRVIDYETAKSKYGNYENFKFIKPGVQFLYSEENNTFYEQYDDDLEHRLVEEVIYYNKGADLEIALLNGVMITAPDNPLSRLDKRYPFAKTGYELIDEGRFFYYKSLAFKSAPDEDVVNKLYRMTIDGTYMQIMPPLATFGNDIIGSSVVVPGRTTPFSQDSKIQKIDTGSNLNFGERMLDRVERSINEGSQSPQQAGMNTPGEKTAFEVSRLEQNAKTLLGLFGRMIGFLVKDVGQLMISDILQYMTVGQVEQLTSPNGGIKYRKVILPERMVDGKLKTKKIEFKLDPDLITYEEMIKRSFDVMGKEGGMESNQRIYEVNVQIFRNMKYMTQVKPDAAPMVTDNIQRALNIEAYDRAMNNPSADQEALYRDLLLGSYSKTADDPDRYIKKESELAQTVGANPTKSPFDTNAKIKNKEIV